MHALPTFPPKNGSQKNAPYMHISTYHSLSHAGSKSLLIYGPSNQYPNLA